MDICKFLLILDLKNLFIFATHRDLIYIEVSLCVVSNQLCILIAYLLIGNILLVIFSRRLPVLGMGEC